MAATYGYGGEFSSDEDIDKMEQQSERLVQSKFDSYLSLKPTRHQVEEAIESIKQLPLDQDVNITDELLAGLLDYYKTQRGPIVDSTRNLYKKIILRLVRGDQQQQQASNGNTESSKDSNGNNNNIVISNNNNNMNILDKRQQSVEAASSDEDEPMPPASSLVENKRKFDSRVAYDDRLEPMEVDSEVTAGGHTIRANKQVDISSSDEDDDSDTEETSDSDSEVLDLTPVKSVVPGQTQQQAAPKLPSQSASSKPGEVVKKSVAAGTATLAKEKTEDTPGAKKPYTRRSQRVAATRATTSARKITQTDVSSSKGDAVASSQGVFQSTGTRRGLFSRFQVRFLISALFVASLALGIYYFRSDLTKTTDRILTRAIKF